MDNTAKMYALMQDTLTTIGFKIRQAPVEDRAGLYPEMIKIQTEFAAYQAKILKDASLATESDMQDLTLIKAEIEQAAGKQQLFGAISRTLSFVVTRKV